MRLDLDESRALTPIDMDESIGALTVVSGRRAQVRCHHGTRISVVRSTNRTRKILYSTRLGTIGGETTHGPQHRSVSS